MVLLESRREAPTRWRHRELTIAEIMSDSIVRAVMKADGVDPEALEATLTSMARAMPVSGSKETGRHVRRASKAMADSMFE